MGRRVIPFLLAVSPLALACGGSIEPRETPVERAVDVTGKDIRDTEYCGTHVEECGRDPAARARFKAARLFSCPENAVNVVQRSDIQDTSLGHTHGRDFRSWWPEGEISRERDQKDTGAVMEVHGCSRSGYMTCFRAHIKVTEPATTRTEEVRYDDPAALECVRWSPWDPAP